MLPTEFDLVIRRGVTFGIELIGQVKVYTYDPATDTTPADLQRTHAENLEHHGFTYEYIDFLTDYNAAELHVYRSYKNGQEAKEPIMTLTLANGDIELTNKSVKVGITDEATQEIDFNAGMYELNLITAAGQVDGLNFGKVTVYGHK